MRAAQRNLRRELLKLGAELRHLLHQLPVHEALLALRLLHLVHGDVAGDEFFHRASRGEDLLDDARREVDARLGEHGVDHLARALEVGAAGGVLAKAGAAQALFILLVPQRAGFPVALDIFKQLRRDRLHLGRWHVLGEVRIELSVLGSGGLVDRYDSRSVSIFLDIGNLVGEVHFHAFVELCVIHWSALSVEKAGIGPENTLDLGFAKSATGSARRLRSWMPTAGRCH